jgi:hypothetical protein
MWPLRASTNWAKQAARWGFSVASIVSMFAVPCGQAGAAGGDPYKPTAVIQVLGTARLFSNTDEHVTTASPIAEGGFLAASAVRRGGMFAYKIAGDGTQVWRTPLRDSLWARSSGMTGDGNYWFGGAVGNPLLDTVQTVSKQGAMLERHVLAHTVADSRLFACAFALDHKFLQVSQVELDQYQRIPTSSVSMTSEDGTRDWEALTPFDKQIRIAPIPQQSSFCAGTFATKDERILAAQRMLVWPPTQSIEGVKQEWSSGIRERLGTLVEAFDLNGHEIARLRDDDTKGGLLLAGPSGAVLIESSYLKPGLTSSTPVDRLVHIRWLNSGLKDAAAPLNVPDGLYDVINAAMLTPRGSLVLSGCSGETARIFVRYISSNRSISAKKELPELGNCEGSYWLAPAAQPNSILLLSEAPGLGTFLTTLHIAE